MKKKGESKISWAVAIVEKLERQERFLKKLLKPIEIKKYINEEINIKRYNTHAPLIFLK